MNNIIPDFLEKEKIDTSEVWTKKIEISKGEKIHVVAPSGRGKTSLIHFLYGMRNDYSGTITFNDTTIRSFSPVQLAGYRKANVSIIFQDLRLFPEHTVDHNIEIKRVLHPFHQHDRVKEMSVQLGIEKKLNQFSGKCSYGEQQRTAIIRSLQQPFDFIIMDEPFSHLDDNNRSIALELIETEAKKRNAGIILADLEVHEDFKADRILYL
jgi:putative ABC transport system ATP-binding protein